MFIKIRHWLIKILTGKMCVMLNGKVSFEKKECKPLYENKSPLIEHNVFIG